MIYFISLCEALCLSINSCTFVIMTGFQQHIELNRNLVQSDPRIQNPVINEGSRNGSPSSYLRPKFRGDDSHLFNKRIPKSDWKIGFNVKPSSHTLEDLIPSPISHISWITRFKKGKDHSYTNQLLPVGMWEFFYRQKRTDLLRTYLYIRSISSHTGGHFSFAPTSKSIAHDLGVSRSSFYDRLRKMKKLGMVKKVSRGYYRFVSIHKICFSLNIKYFQSIVLNTKAHILTSQTVFDAKCFSQFLYKGFESRLKKQKHEAHQAKKNGEVLKSNTRSVRDSMIDSVRIVYGTFATTTLASELNRSIATISKLKWKAESMKFIGIKANVNQEVANMPKSQERFIKVSFGREEFYKEFRDVDTISVNKHIHVYNNNSIASKLPRCNYEQPSITSIDCISDIPFV